MTAECTTAATSLLQSFAPAVSWILVIVGWSIVRHDNNRREARKEVKTLVDQAISRSEDICEMARSYFEAPVSAESHKQSARIKAGLKTLGTEINTLRETTSSAVDAQKAMISLRKATTGGDFDSAARQAALHTDPIFDEIDEALITFHRKLTESFCRLPR